MEGGDAKYGGDEDERKCDAVVDVMGSAPRPTMSRALLCIETSIRCGTGIIGSFEIWVHSLIWWWVSDPGYEDRAT